MKNRRWQPAIEKRPERIQDLANAVIPFSKSTAIPESL